jgi:outer membrane protein assembly factor BamB
MTGSVVRTIAAGAVAMAAFVSLRAGESGPFETNTVWPQFRGPDSMGVADGSRIPTRWSKTENVAWSIEVPGRGWSSPVVWNDQVFVTSAVSPGPFKEPSTGIYGNDYIAELRRQGLPPEEVSRRVRARDNEVPDEISADVEWRLFCYDARTGARRWDALIHRGRPFGGRHRKNTYASETPVTDGQRVYVYLGNVGLFAWSMEGAPLWRTPIEPQRIYLDFGTASSPVLHAGRVIVLNDNQQQSALLAFDAKTGTLAWQTKRDHGQAMVRSSFSTPFIWRTPQRTEIVVQGPTTVTSYDVEGRELWKLRQVSQVGAPTPVASGSLLLSSSGSPSENVRPLVAIRAGASGEMSYGAAPGVHAAIAWSQERGGSYITSPLVYDGRVYVLFDQGFFGVTELATGRSIYKVRIGEGGVAFSASPWAVDGRIYCLSEDGDTYVFAAGDTHTLLATNGLGEMSLATPAVVRDGLFIRTATRLYRVGRPDA